MSNPRQEVNSNHEMTQVNVEDSGLDYSKAHGFKQGAFDIIHNNLDTENV